MASLEDVVAETKAAVGALIRKPKMSDKLLSRPPFRFLHDTVMAIDGKTGFLGDLFDARERDSAQITDKEAKVAFLNKLVAFVGVCDGAPVDVRPLKIVSGAEPERTNVLLQTIARTCSDDSIDFSAAVEMVNNGVVPGTVPRKGASDAQESKNDAEEQQQQDEQADAAPSSTEGKEPEAPAGEAKADEDDEAAPDEAKQEPTTKEPSASSSSTSGMDLSAADGEVGTTMQLLDGLIRKPKLTEKLLKRPPFRFLHDIMTNLNQGHGVLDGLFQGAELNAKDCGGSKEGKLAYLNKLIEFAKICAGTPFEVKAKAIVAGQEAQNTNKLLQVIALITRAGGQGAISAAEAVQKALGDDVEAPAKAARPASRASASKPTREQTGPAPTEEKNDTATEDRGGEGEAKDEDRHEIQEPAARTMSSRPQTARKRPPKIRDSTAAVGAADASRPGTRGQAGRPVGVMMDGQDSDDDGSEEDDEQPEAVRLRRQGAEDANPAFDDANGPKSKLVRDILDDEAKDAEQKERESAAEEGQGEAKKGEAGNSASTGGITMGKIGQGFRKGSKGTGPSAAGKGAVQVDKIRSVIQLLCQSTNPLGKCMDYVHEDLSTMSKELDKWRAEYRKSCDQMEDEQRVTSETMLPLRGKLREVEEEIKDKQVRLATLKAAIAKNDARIAELLQDMVLG